MIDRRRFLIMGTIASSGLLFPSTSCKKTDVPTTNSNGSSDNSLSSGSLTLSNSRTDKGAYIINQQIGLSFVLTNTTTEPIALNELHVLLKDISNAASSFSLTVTLGNNITVAAGQQYAVNGTVIWTVPTGALTDAFGIYFGGTLQDNSTFSDTYATFFRVVSASQLLNYTIGSSTYNGLAVYTLDGGLSAEYTVEKSAEILSDGISHSWYTSSPGSGPNSVYSTPGFLESSINCTVNFYNKTFGASTSFPTVVITTGVASIPYLSRVMGAPVLPLHFLVSVNTVKEVMSILNYNQQTADYPGYATLGYDASISMAVAWIKLLALPQQYVTFLMQHNVQNVVFAGTYGTNGGGETTAKKILYNSNPVTGYNIGDLYLMYPAGGTDSDITSLYDKIIDLHDYDSIIEPNYRQIADWESGIVDEQINSMSTTISSSTTVINQRRISAADSLTMYNLATYLTLAFMKKNSPVFTMGGAAVSGVVLNPYLLSHPTYESKIQYVPMLFWQGNSGSDDVTRLITTIKQSILNYFPATNFNNLTFWINTSLNFGGYQTGSIQSALAAQGLANVKFSNINVDEVWNLSDGVNSICETVASDIITNSSPSAYKTWDSLLIKLSVNDLDALGNAHSDISVVTI